MSDIKSSFPCPACSGKVTIQSEFREHEYKGKAITALFFFYKCNKCNEQFTTTETDEMNISSIKKQYDNENSRRDT